MQNILTEVQNYWTRRSTTYSISNNREYNQWQNKAYTDIFTHYLPEQNSLNVLDIGCGPGFFSMLLAAMGHHVTGIDLTDEMLVKAANNLIAHRLCASFMPMNAQVLDFEDSAFDIAVSRNLTWNLLDPHAAYKEWARVLKPGGLLLNFDANWYRYLYERETEVLFRRDKKNVKEMGYKNPITKDMAKTMEDIAMDLPLSRVDRPEWDAAILKEIGFSKVIVDEHIGEHIYTPEEQVLYRTARSFLLVATK